MFWRGEYSLREQSCFLMGFCFGVGNRSMKAKRLFQTLCLAKTHWLREHAVVHIPGELMSPLQEALRLCSQLSHVFIRTLAHHECHSSHTVLDR